MCMSSHVYSHSGSFYFFNTHTQMHTTGPAARDSADIIAQMSAPKKCPWTLLASMLHSGSKKPHLIAYSHKHIHLFVHIHITSSLYLCRSLSICLTNILTCPPAPIRCVVAAFFLSVTPGTLLPDFTSDSLFQFSFSVTDTHIPVAVYVPWKPTFNDSSRSHFYFLLSRERLQTTAASD